MPAIPVLQRLRQEDQKLEVSLGCKARPCFKKKKKQACRSFTQFQVPFYFHFFHDIHCSFIVNDKLKNKIYMLGAAAHAYNPSYSGDRAQQDHS
jgi:hypothetical protein